MPDQRDVQQLIQSLTPSAVNNGNPNTVYNQPQPQGGYIPPTYDAGTNTWRINPAPAPSTVNWQQMSANQPQSWGWQGPTQPTPPPVVAPPVTTPTGPTTPVPPPVTGGTGTAPPIGLPSHLPQSPAVTPNYYTQDDSMNGCVVVDSFLSDYDRADEVEVGDEMFVIDPVSYRKSVGKVSYSETKLMPCVRIMTESGITLDCSRTAPIADEHGNQILAPDLLNKLVPVCDRGVFYLDRVSSIEDLGELEVRHITVEDNFFLAGKEKGKYLFHHNMKMGPGSAMNLNALYEGRENQFGWSNNTGGFGAESMSSGSMFGPRPEPSTNYTPTGQGLVDAFGNPASPDTPTDLSGYMSAPWVGTGQSPVSNYTPPVQADMPTLPNVTVNGNSEQGFWGGLWDSVKAPILTAADWLLKGNLYHSDTGEVAPWESWVTSAIDTAAGLGGMGQQAWDTYGKSGLKDGYNDTSSAERTAIGNLQYQYQQASPQKQAQMLQSMTKPGSGYPQAVIDAVTGSESYWQGTR